MIKETVELLPNFFKTKEVDLIVATSGYCQALCESCVWPYMTPSRSVMNVEQFGRLLDTFAGFRFGEIAFNIINEPFTDRTVVEKLRLLAERSVTAHVVFFSSNWLIPDRAKLESFAQAARECALVPTINYVTLNATLSGIDEESYDVLQAGANLTNTTNPYRKLDFAKAVGNVLEVLRLLQDRVPWEKTIFRIKAYGNLFSQDDLSQFWTEQFRKAHLSKGFIERCVKVLLNSGYTSFARMERPLANRAPRWCSTGWVDNRVLVGPNGEVGLCCEDGLRSIVLGNIFETDLMTLCRSESYQDYMRIVRGLERPSANSPCNSCQFFIPLEQAAP